MKLRMNEQSGEARRGGQPSLAQPVVDQNLAARKQGELVNSRNVRSWQQPYQGRRMRRPLRAVTITKVPQTLTRHSP